MSRSTRRREAAKAQRRTRRRARQKRQRLMRGRALIDTSLDTLARLSGPWPLRAGDLLAAVARQMLGEVDLLA